MKRFTLLLLFGVYLLLACDLSRAQTYTVSVVNGDTLVVTCGSTGVYPPAMDVMLHFNGIYQGPHTQVDTIALDPVARKYTWHCPNTSTDGKTTLRMGIARRFALWSNNVQKTAITPLPNLPWLYPAYKPDYGTIGIRGWLCVRGDLTQSRSFDGAWIGTRLLWQYSPTEMSALSQFPVCDNDAVYLPAISLTPAVNKSYQSAVSLSPTGIQRPKPTGGVTGFDAPVIDKSPALLNKRMYWASDGNITVNYAVEAPGQAGGYDTWGPTYTDGTRLCWINTTRVDAGGPSLRYGLIAIAGVKRNAPVPPIASDGTFCAVSLSAEWTNTPGLYGKNVLTGATVWSKPELLSNGLLYSDGVLVSSCTQQMLRTSASSFLAGLDLQTGAIKWAIPSTAVPQAAGGGRVFVQQGATLSALDMQTGRTLWTQQRQGTILAYAKASGTLILVVPSDPAGIVTLRASDGSVVSVNTVPAVFSNAAFIGNRMYAVSEKNVYGFDSPQVEASSPIPAVLPAPVPPSPVPILKAQVVLPATARFVVGETLRASVWADAATAYQWKIGDTVLTETGPTLSLSMQTSYAGQSLICTATDAGGNTVSLGSTLLSATLPPVIAIPDQIGQITNGVPQFIPVQPTVQNAIGGEAYTWLYQSPGTTTWVAVPIGYVSGRKWCIYQNALSSFLYLMNYTASDSGTLFKCTVKNAVGSSSVTFRLSVLSATQPTDDHIQSAGYSTMWSFSCFRNYQAGTVVTNKLTITQSGRGSVNVTLTGKEITYETDAAGNTVAAHIKTTGNLGDNADYPVLITADIKVTDLIHKAGTFRWQVVAAPNNTINKPGTVLMDSALIANSTDGYIPGLYKTDLQATATTTIPTGSK